MEEKEETRCIPLILHQKNSIWIKDNIFKMKQRLDETREIFLFLFNIAEWKSQDIKSHKIKG